MYPIAPKADGRGLDDTALREEIRQFTQEGAAKGAKPQDIRDRLEDAGFHGHAVNRIIEDAYAVGLSATIQSSGTRSFAVRNILLGILCWIVGAVLTMMGFSGLITLPFGVAGLLMMGLGIQQTGQRPTN